MNLLLATLWVNEEDAVIDYSYNPQKIQQYGKTERKSREKIKLKVQVNAHWVNGQKMGIWQTSTYHISYLRDSAKWDTPFALKREKQKKKSNAQYGVENIEYFL